MNVTRRFHILFIRSPVRRDSRPVTGNRRVTTDYEDGSTNSCPNVRGNRAGASIVFYGTCIQSVSLTRYLQAKTTKILNDRWVYRLFGNNNIESV